MILPKESATFSSCRFNFFRVSLSRTRVISQVVSEILRQPDADFGNKYEIMDLFTKAVQNGNDPLIVESQISSAAYYGRNKPQSSYTLSLTSLFYFRRFSHRRRFW